MRYRVVGAFVVASAALAMSSCGSGGAADSGPAESSAIEGSVAVDSAGAYFEDANRICLELKAALSNPDETPEGLAEVNADLVAKVRQAVEHLRALTPPSGTEAEAKEIYDQLDELAAKQEALYTTDWSTPEDLDEADAELLALADASARSAADFGLTDCDLNA